MQHLDQQTHPAPPAGVFPGQHPYVDVIDAVAVKVECLGRQSSWNLDGELLSTQCLSAEVHQGLLEVSGWQGGRGLGWWCGGVGVCVWLGVCGAGHGKERVAAGTPVCMPGSRGAHRGGLYSSHALWPLPAGVCPGRGALMPS